MSGGTLKTADVADALERKGAEPADTHHKMYRRYVDGKLAATTRLSRSEREIGRPRQNLMAQQCLLTTKQFVGLVECWFSAEDWEQAIRQRS